MNAKLIIFGAAIVISLLWLSVQTGAAFSKATVQKEFNQTYALAATGQVQLDNVNGKVRITAWDRAEVKVEAIKLAETEEELEAVNIVIDSKPDQIRIRTKYPSTKWSLWKRHNSTTVEYDIKVPSHAVLEEIKNVNGRVEIEGVHGRVHASTVNGKLTVEGLTADADLGSVNGSVLAAFDNLDAVKRGSTGLSAPICKGPSAKAARKSMPRPSTAPSKCSELRRRAHPIQSHNPPSPSSKRISTGSARSAPVLERSGLPRRRIVRFSGSGSRFATRCARGRAHSAKTRTSLAKALTPPPARPRVGRVSARAGHKPTRTWAKPSASSPLPSRP